MLIFLLLLLFHFFGGNKFITKPIVSVVGRWSVARIGEVFSFVSFFFFRVHFIFSSQNATTASLTDQIRRQNINREAESCGCRRTALVESRPAQIEYTNGK